MIKQEVIEINNKQFKKTYSSEGYYILQVETGNEYDIAIDILEAKYTYKETDKKIEEEENDN